MIWNEEKLKLLLELYREGLNSYEISKKIEIDRRKITNKLAKLGFKTDRTKSFSHLYEEKKCLCCENKFKNIKTKNRKFCSQSCAAKYNNCKRDENGNIIIKFKEKNCLCCGEKLNNNNKKTNQTKFCGLNCQNKFLKLKRFERIESGDLTLNTKQYKSYLIDKHGAKCMECGWNKINPTTGLVPIQLEHEDGNSDNNDLKNLKLLCPNCHSLTPTFGSLNKNGRDSKRKKYRKEWRGKFENKERKIVPVVKKNCKNCNKDFFDKEGKIFCSLDCYKTERRKKIPSKEEILYSFKELKSFVNVGKKYGVSDSAVKKWCLIYDIKLKK